MAKRLCWITFCRFILINILFDQGIRYQKLSNQYSHGYKILINLMACDKKSAKENFCFIDSNILETRVHFQGQR